MVSLKMITFLRKISLLLLLLLPSLVRCAGSGRGALDAQYDVCVKTGRCVQFPHGCVQEYLEKKTVTSICHLFVSWDTNFKFHMSGKSQPNTYIAFGISTDTIMGGDSVAVCMNVNGEAKVARYSTLPEKSVHREDGDPGLKGVTATIVDGIIYCNFEQEDHQIKDGLKIEFSKGEYHILDAAGTLDVTGNNIVLHQHQTDEKHASVKAIKFTAEKPKTHPSDSPQDSNACRFSPVAILGSIFLLILGFTL